MSTTDPDQIRADIERTRSELSQDVDALEDKVSPSRVAQRQADRVRSRATAVKERIMGTASHAKDSLAVGTDAVSGTAHDLTGSAGGVVSGAGQAVRDLPHTLARQTEGNPLAAGLIAFAAGWLVGSVIPASRPEQQAAGAVKEHASEVADEAKAVAKEAAENLREPVVEAGEQVKQAAADAASTLKDQGSQAASDVKQQASGAAETVRDQTQSHY
jgi:ElaB/YqjD/DUF883 family membrane-anchored ribosome-binding protein